ncbi:MAG: BMP family ABC transporter substrate-binding protein [Actinomycetota bacterium]
MKKTWKLWMVLVAVLALVAAACGDDDDDTETSSETSEESTDTGDTEEGTESGGIRVAIVAPSAENDLAFTQSIVDGTAALTGVSEIAITPGTFVVEDAATAIRDYAEDGYDLVIGHGSQYGGSIEQIAADFPDTAFAWGTAIDTFGLPNVSAYTAASNEGGYVLGAMAAAQGSTIGVVGPIEVGDAKLYVDGFALGAEDNGATVNVVYIESFSDVQLASETATAFVNDGAEILTGTAQMTVGAIGVAEQEGLLWYGTQSNQASAAGDGIVVASQVYKWEIALQSLVDDIAGGSLGGESYEINLGNGGLVIEYASADDDLQAIADTAIDAVIAGEVTTIPG